MRMHAGRATSSDFSISNIAAHTHSRHTQIEDQTTTLALLRAVRLCVRVCVCGCRRVAAARLARFAEQRWGTCSEAAVGVCCVHLVMT
jgi:hypothetical protein